MVSTTTIFVEMKLYMSSVEVRKVVNDPDGRNDKKAKNLGLLHGCEEAPVRKIGTGTSRQQFLENWPAFDQAGYNGLLVGLKSFGQDNLFTTPVNVKFVDQKVLVTDNLRGLS